MVETRAKLSHIAKERQFGGHTSKRKLWYTQVDGTTIFLQSSYEVLLAQLLDKMNVKWTRPEPFKWVDEKGVDHRYYPDFKVGDVFIDTKNDFLIKKDAVKIAAVKEQNNINLVVISLDQITEDYIASLI